MPIRFRCRHCRQFLGISRAKAGTITDCPTCGKSIRVPNLDGSIDPIPSPGLNLQDEQLAEALGELARLGSSKGSKESEKIASPERITERQKARVTAPKAEAVFLPEAEPAQPISPLPRQESQPLPRQESQAVIPLDRNAGTKVDAAEALRALADSPPIRTTASFRSRRSRTERIWLIGSLIAAAAVGLLAVYWVSAGRESSPRSLDAESEKTLPDQQGGGPLPGQRDRPHVPLNDVPLDEATTLSGQITYITAGGDRRPDAGARILLLPKRKLGRVKLDVAGFGTGADDVDTHVARAAVRALGGDLAEADEDGHYRVSLTGHGDYHLLAISRHLPRESAESVDPQLHNALSAYFFRPASLLGQLAFQWNELHFAGDSPSRRNITFAAE